MEKKQIIDKKRQKSATIYKKQSQKTRQENEQKKEKTVQSRYDHLLAQENLNHHSRVLTSLTHHYLNNKTEYKNLNLIRQDQYSKDKEVRESEDTQSKISLLKYAKHCHKSGSNDYNQDLKSDFY